MESEETQIYYAVFARVLCGDIPEYYLQAQGDLGTIVTLPENAPAEVFTFAVDSPAIAGDLDGNKIVNLKDYNHFSRYWLDATCPAHQACGCDGADINQDGIVNQLDLLKFNDTWLDGPE